MGLLYVGLALPAALRGKSWKRFGIAFILTHVGVVLPVMTFCASALLLPDWKGGCRYGWLDCFHFGKFALLPFVLWASAALYAVEILVVKDRTRYWIVLGMVWGALVSSLCLVFGILTVAVPAPHGLAVWLIVPLYMAVWYVVRAAKLARTSRTPWIVYLVSFSSSIPFWIGSVVWSRRSYIALPDQRTECFIVTATLRGHARLVGPFVDCTRHGQHRRANRQLMTFWQLEQMWRQRLPRSHKCFRSVYNRLGPRIALMVGSPTRADIVYLALKPVELLARLLVDNLQRPELQIHRPNNGAPGGEQSPAARS